jgi:hypothetical protein
LGSGVFVAGGVADSLITSVHPVIGLSSKGPLLSPSVRLGLVWANSNTQRAGTAELVLGLRLLVLSGCLLRVPLGEGAGLRLCAALEGGVLTAQPFAIELPRAITKAWFAADPLARLEIPLLRSLLTLEIEAGIAVPFQQLRTYVNPGPIVSDAGSVGLRLGADVVLQAF